MKAIRTKYFGPTNTKGARIKVWAEDNKAKFADYDYARDLADQCEDIAEGYACRLGWLTDGIVIHSGSIADGYVHVLARS